MSDDITLPRAYAELAPASLMSIDEYLACLHTTFLGHVRERVLNWNVEDSPLSQAIGISRVTLYQFLLHDSDITVHSLRKIHGWCVALEKGDV